MLIVAAAAGCLIAGLLLGHELGQRALWKNLHRDQRLGNKALESLAEAHGAKVQIWQGPGG